MKVPDKILAEIEGYVDVQSEGEGLCRDIAKRIAATFYKKGVEDGIAKQKLTKCPDCGEHAECPNFTVSEEDPGVTYFICNKCHRNNMFGGPI